MQVLVNLPPTFFTCPSLTEFWRELEAEFVLRKASCNTIAEIEPHLANQDAMLMWSWPDIPGELLDRNPQLGFSGNIDIRPSLAKRFLERGIAVSVSRRGFSPAVSELALTLMLACLRRTSSYHAAMWAGQEEWVKHFPGDIPVEERQLTGRTVGIVGLGGVGGRLAQLLAPFEVQLLVYDPFVPADHAARLGATLVSLDELVKRSEIVVLCAAANENTAHLLNGDLISQLAPNAILINVARAALVDSAALYERLQRGELFAALDVFDVEPLPADSPLRALSNLYLTPHRAGGILESVQRILQYLADDLRRFRDGQPRYYALTEAMLSTLDV